MSAPSSPHSACSTLDAPESVVPDRKVVKILVKILTARHGVLHYHGQTGELATYQWPTDRHGQKIHPSQFAAYREAHAFLYPCCLCATADRYVETSVLQRAEGINQGQYVAECATSTCGYLLTVEKFFGRASVPAAYYRKRKVTRRPARIRHMLNQDDPLLRVKVEVK
ncbi:hypothetical protein AZE42_09892 [Rhizopogon vesiculosus]|uniref:Uncharacterized protein n=1 Tax=Rhizopogon vesiculosus TaxID=180088 RepID=A0A1J8Q8I9_9AGAM|nr:hypothetical protein AZE42_09892 [Rhizopogon vesiculosus]